VLYCARCSRPFVYPSTSSLDCALSRDGHVPRRLQKDNDLTARVLLPVADRDALARQMRTDVEWLAAHRIMDYSLLLSMRRCVARVPVSGRLLGAAATSPREGATASSALVLYVGDPPARMRRRVQALLVEGPSCWHLGIVDWWGEWGMRKRVEHAVKVWGMCRTDRDAAGFTGVSAVEPREYADRFLARVVDVVFPRLAGVVEVVSADVTFDVLATLDVSGAQSAEDVIHMLRASLGLLEEEQDGGEQSGAGVAAAAEAAAAAPPRAWLVSGDGRRTVPLAQEPFPEFMALAMAGDLPQLVVDVGRGGIVAVPADVLGGVARSGASPRAGGRAS